MRPDSLRYLELGLNGCHTHQNSAAKAPGRTSSNGAMNGFTNAVWSLFSTERVRQASDLPQHTPGATTTSASSVSTSSSVPQEVLYLLLCVPWKCHATRMLNVDLRQVVSDMHFFRLLRDQYAESKTWKRLLSPRSLSAIRFVEVGPHSSVVLVTKLTSAQFELHAKDLADIRQFDAIPPARRSNEYTYTPLPADHVPPIGQNLLRHLYDHPEDANALPVCFRKVPKKLKDRLVVSPTHGVSTGWGIVFVERISWAKLSLMGLSGVMLSLTFGVIWTVLRQDIQGGFGVASFMLTIFIAGVGAAQGLLEP